MGNWLDWAAALLACILFGTIVGSVLFVWWANQFGPWKNRD
jgi:hypothetical protein